MAHRRHRATHALAAAFVAVALSIGACQSTRRIPDTPAPVDLQPVSPLAGWGMEVRVWDLDTTAWQRSRRNEELSRLYEAWQAIEAARAGDQEQAEAAATEPATTSQVADQAATPTFGPAAEPSQTEPQTFEEFVRTRSVPIAEHPGLELLGTYNDIPQAIEANATELWSRNGFQISMVPIEDLATLRQAMGIQQPLERTWWASSAEWSRLASGPPQDRRRVDTDLGPLEVGPGRFALTGRAWVGPGTREPVLNLEVCPQFLPSRSSSERLEERLSSRLLGEQTPPSALDEGPLFERLLLWGAIPAGQALLLMPLLDEPANPTLGPQIPGVTVGNAVLNGIGPDGTLRPRAIVIVPVLPDWFSIDVR